MACQKYAHKQDVALDLSHSTARVSRHCAERLGLQAGAVPCTVPGSHVGLTGAGLHVLPLKYLFPTSMLWLTQPRQRISEISVIIRHFVQDKISLESICLKKKQHVNTMGRSLLFSPCT